MRYLVRINDLEKKIDYLKRQLDIIDESIINLEKDKQLLKWEGTAYESFIKKYDEYIVKLKKIEESTIVSIGYLMQYYDKYGTRYKSLKTKYINTLGMEGKNGLNNLSRSNYS